MYTPSLGLRFKEWGLHLNKGGWWVDTAMLAGSTKVLVLEMLGTNEESSHIGTDLKI